MTGPMDISDDQSSLLLTFVHRSLVAGGGWSVIALLGAMPSLDRSPPEGMLEKKPSQVFQVGILRPPTKKRRPQLAPGCTYHKAAAPTGAMRTLHQAPLLSRRQEARGDKSQNGTMNTALPAAACRGRQGMPPQRQDPGRGSRVRQEGQLPVRHERKFLGHSKYEPGI